MKTLLLLVLTVLVGCFSGPLTPPDNSPAGSALADERCVPSSAAWSACEMALQRATACCWDAFAVSSDPATLTPTSLCRAIVSARPLEDPAEVCAWYAAQFSMRDDGTCAFDAQMVSSGAILSVPLCCCDRGRACLRQGSSVTCGEAPR